MSLWTPGGEHEVPREPAAEPSSSGSAPGAADTEVPPGLLPEGVSLDDLSPEERARVEEMIAQMGEAQRQLVEAPIEVVIGNHAIGFYELAALHLQQNPPNLRESRLAIDAMAAVVDKLGDDLGEAAEPLRNALIQIQTAFIQIKDQAEA
jgi:hypothetical protein